MTNTKSDIFLASWHPYFWICAASAILYSKTLSFGFTHLDDNALILYNQGFLRDIFNISRVFRQRVFFDGLLPYYRPLLTISLMLDAQIGGVNLFVYHLTNIMIHAAASALVFLLLLKLNYRKALAFFFSLVFAVHPLLSQAVAWVPGRNDSLMAAFAIASFIFFLDFIKKRRWPYYALHMALFTLALFTKESACILMVMTFLYLVFISKKRVLSFEAGALASGYCLVSAGWYLLRQAAVRNSPIEMTIFDMTKYLITYLPAVIQFIGKAVFPFNLSVFPIIQDTSFVYGIAAIVGISLALFFSKNKRYNYIFFGLSWLVFFLLPALVRPHAGVINDVLEHRFYMSMVGLIIVFLEIDFIKNGKRWVGRSILAAAALLVFSAITSCHSGLFRDRLTFWKSAVRSSPHAAFAHLALGSAYYEEKDIDKAEDEFKRSLELDGWIIRSNYFLGFVYMQKGRAKEAEASFRKEIALHPDFDASYTALGVLYYRQGRFDEAEGLWDKALRLRPNNVEVLKNLAIYYCERKEFQKSAYYARRIQDMGGRPPPEFLAKIGMA